MSKPNTITCVLLTATAHSVRAILSSLSRRPASDTSKLSCLRIILLLACWALASTPVLGVTVQFKMQGYVAELSSVTATLQRDGMNVGSLLLQNQCQSWSGHTCDCGDAYQGPTFQNVSLVCGEYRLTVTGRAVCSGVTVFFNSIPAGYMIEIQALLNGAPSGAPVEWWNSAGVTFSLSNGTKEWLVTLKPKRIRFNESSLPADGRSQAQATVNFHTGSSSPPDWFTGAPTWSIVGDKVGCTIDANTGWIRAGTEPGEITVRATDSGGTAHFLSGTLKIGCQGCGSGSCGIGQGMVGNLRNALAVGLGDACDGSSMGSIRLKLTNPSTSLPTRAGLTYDQTSTDNALPEILNDTIANYNTPVRQVLAAQCLADIVNISSPAPGYEIRVYWPEDILVQNGIKQKANGYYVLNNGAVPFKVWQVTQRGTDVSGNVTEFWTTEDPSGANIVNKFTWNVSDAAWTLNRNGLTQERKIVTTSLPDVYPDREVHLSRRSETTEISTPGNPNVVSRVTKTYATLNLNSQTLQIPDVLAEERQDGHKADGSIANVDQFTAYTYATTATTDLRPKLLRVTRSDGSWEHYVYTGDRITTIYTPWLDSVPPANIDSPPSSVANKKTVYDYTPLSGDTRSDDTVTARTIQTYVDTTGGGSPQTVSLNYVIVTSDTATFPTVDVRKDIAASTAAAQPGDTPNLVTITRTYSGGAFKGSVRSVERPDGTRTVYSYTDTTQQVSEGAPGAAVDTVSDGKKTTTTQTAHGFTKTTLATDILSGKTLLSDSWSGTEDAQGRYPILTHLDGTTETYTYDCCNTTRIVGRDGQTSVFAPDGLKRIWSTVNYYSASTTYGIETRSTLDAMGNVTKTTRIGSDSSGSTSIDLVPLREYDRAGRMVREQNALLGYTTVTEGNTTPGGGRMVTTTYPDTGTRIEEYYRDGRLAKVSGTAVQPIRYDYDFEPASGQLYTTETKLDASYNTTSEWTKTYADFLGRAYKTVWADNAYRQTFYADAKGQLWKERDPDGVLTVYIYNPRGEVEYTEFGLKTEPTTPPTAPLNTGEHRVTWMQRSVTTYTDGGTAYDAVLTQSSEWTTLDSSASIITSQIFTSADGRREWNIAYPGQTFQQLVKNVTQYATGGSRTTTQTYPDNSYQVSTFSYGRPSIVKRYGSDNSVILQTTFTYNRSGLLATSTDLRNGSTTYTYNNADQVASVTSPPPGTGLAQTRSTIFDTSIRPIQVTEPDGTVGYTRFYKNGLVKLTWGTRTLPSGYEYDAQGRLTKLYTWRSFAAPDPSLTEPPFPAGSVITLFEYDQYRGWLNDKRYTDTKGPDYTYTPGGRLRSRSWWRVVPGTATRLKTTYTYDFDAAGLNANRMAGYLARIDYNDGTVPAGEISTAPLVFDYDRRGRGRTVQQGVTGSFLTTTLAWHLAGALDSETYQGAPLDTLALVAGNVDAASLLRRASIETRKSGSAIAGTSVTYGYDTASRLQTVTSSGTTAFSATYGYVPNSSLVGTTTLRQTTTTRLTTSSQFDSLNRLQSISATPSAAANQPPLSRAYTYNDANQRTRRTDGDSSYWQYSYDNKGEVTGAKRYWFDNQIIPGQQFEYGYDDIGNWLMAKQGGDQNGASLRQTTYVPDDLNRYSSRSMNVSDRKIDITGLGLVQNGTPTTASITAGGTAYNPDYRRGEYFWKAAPASGAGPNWLPVSITDGATTASGNLYVPPQNETFTYDDDGNLSSDARWVYKWDAENRLARMDTQVSAVTAGIPPKSIFFSYDYQGRLMRRQAYTSGTLDTAAGSDLLFLYDGMQCIAALKSDQTLYQAYVWGQDLSGSLGGAGGVGGLLMFRKAVPGGTETYFPTYDGNGNVMELIKGEDGSVSGSAGTVVARYEYGPFGQLLRATGEPVALDNPFRFSTKYQDDQTDLIYYGFRYYSPNTGRWLSRDPIEEFGGPNLGYFCSNDPVDRIDAIGFSDFNAPPSSVRLPRYSGASRRGFFEGPIGDSTFKFDSVNFPDLARKYPDGVHFVGNKPDLSRYRVGDLNCRGVTFPDQFPIQQTGDHGMDRAQVIKQIDQRFMKEAGLSMEDAIRARMEMLEGMRLHHHLDTDLMIVVPGDLHGGLAHMGRRAEVAAQIRAGGAKALNNIGGAVNVALFALDFSDFAFVNSPEGQSYQMAFYLAVEAVPPDKVPGFFGRVHNKCCGDLRPYYTRERLRILMKTIEQYEAQLGRGGA